MSPIVGPDGLSVRSCPTKLAAASVIGSHGPACRRGKPTRNPPRITVTQQLIDFSHLNFLLR